MLWYVSVETVRRFTGTTNTVRHSQKIHAMVRGETEMVPLRVLRAMRLTGEQLNMQSGA
jgi:hypothetical protein